MREREVEKYLVKRVKELGGTCRKAVWIGARGCPDRMVLLPGRAPIFVELKAPGQKLQPHQEREHKRLRDAGVRVATIDSLEGVDQLCQ